MVDSFLFLFYVFETQLGAICFGLVFLASIAKDNIAKVAVKPF